MQENKFEKQVQDRMEELSFSPSPEVWQKVEEEIKKKRDRRRILIWLFPLVLLTGGAGIWLYTNSEASKTQRAVINNNTNNDIKSSIKEENNNERVTQKWNESSINKNTKETLNKEVAIDNEVRENNKVNKTDYKTIYEIENNEKQIAPKRLLSTTSKSINKNYISKNDQLNNKNESASLLNKEPLLSQNSSVTDVLSDTIKTDVSNYVTAVLPQNDTSAIVKEDEKKIEELIPEKDSVTPVNKPLKQNKKWTWGLIVGGGRSGIKDGFLGSSAKSMDAFAMPNTAAAPGFNIRPPSAIKADFSFSAGVTLKRKLGDRTAVLSGIQYSLYTTHMAVGTNVRRDTAVQSASIGVVQLSNYYTNSAQTKEYKNQYHFLELPLILEYRLFKKVPLLAQGGIVLSHLLSTDALLYNRNSNIYYSDKNAFRKTGMLLMAGLNYEVLKNKKTSLLLGPQVQYGLSRLGKEAQSQNHYLFFAGINTRISF